MYVCSLDTLIRWEVDFPGVQWVRLCVPNAEGPGLIPGHGTRSHMHAETKSLHVATKSSHAATRIPCAATKSQHSQNK